MSMSSAMNISSEGLDAASQRLEIYAHNIANLGTPYYKRKIPVVSENQVGGFESVLGEVALGSGGVMKASLSAGPGGAAMVGTVEDPTPGNRVYQPGHPQADKDGYVTYSNVNVLNDMADATMAQRLYEANLAVITIVKSMANRALEIGRGQ